MMRRSATLGSVAALCLLLLLPLAATAQSPSALGNCKDCAYSTEEDFLSQGPVPPDGNPLISDGDLLSCSGAVCLRNDELLAVFDITQDLGLDAVDVLDVEAGLVAFSTELDSPTGSFTQGDLLTTWGAIIPNQALLYPMQVAADRGLDAVHVVGDPQALLAFHDYAKGLTRAEWLRNPGKLAAELDERSLDIWFSIEGTELAASVKPILDGDLLSVLNGIIVPHENLLPASVPAGIPSRGVDFGLDAVSAPRDGYLNDIRFSTEILYGGRAAFDDGDILKVGNGVVIAANNLYAPFEPKAGFLGTDAFYLRQHYVPQVQDFLSLILKLHSITWPVQGAPSRLAPRVGRLGN